MTETDTAKATGEFDAVAAFANILSGDADKEDTAKATPAEESDDEEETEAQTESLDDAADEDADEADEAAEGEEDDAEEEAPQALDPQTDKVTVKLKLGDNIEEVSLEEVAKGYLRQSDYTRKTTELAATRKEIEADRQSARGERETYATLIDALQTKLEQLEAVEKVDFDALFRENPAEYIRQEKIARERDDHLRAAAAEKARIDQERAKESQAARAARVEATWAAAVETIPAWRDEKKWERDRTSILAYAKEQGFTETEINDICSTDARVLLTMHRAAQHAKLLKNKPAPDRAPASPQPPMRSSRGVAPKTADEATRAKQRLKQDGSLSSAAAVFKTLF